jgi:hypothetical protein
MPTTRKRAPRIAKRGPRSFADAYLSIAVCFALSVMMVPLMRKSGSKGANRVAQANDPEEAENAAERLYARV